MNMDQNELIQKALVGFRSELPSEKFFSNVLSEFHKRQRMSQLQKKSFWMRFTEFLSDMWFFQPSKLLQVSAVSLFALFFTLNGIRDSWSSASTSFAGLTSDTSVSMEMTPSESLFVTSNALDQLGSRSLTQGVELASLSGEAVGSDRIQYVSRSMPETYDTVVAF